MRIAAALGLAAFLLGGKALAQDPEPADAAPVLAPPAPAPPVLPPGVTPIHDDRPMRFVMTGGNVVAGRRVGEDQEFFWVALEPGGELARVRKSEVGSMDYRLGEPAPDAPASAAARAERAEPETPPPLDLGPEDPSSGRARRGRGLVIGGGVLFGLFYLGTAVYAPAAPGPGALLFIPIFGPIFYGAAQELGGDEMALMVIASLLQAGGALMLYLGVRQMTQSSQDEAAGESPSFALAPAVVPGGFALAGVARF
ncbi:MAG: hypothetical protein HYY06_13770 [Deltaproteobacteria bacterium]|nr:hypothetical protein [Deltaproteobacteria bacterium]